MSFEICNQIDKLFLMEEKLFFKNSKGNKLCGILSNPTGDKTKPIVILVHGFSSGKDSSTNIALVERLNKKSISTFRIDLFAHGESEGSFENLTQSEAVDDVIQAIEFLKSLGFTKIGLEGSSFGGLAAIMAASKSKDTYLLAIKCPVSSYFEFKEYTNKDLIEDWKKNGYSYRENKKLNFTFYEDIKNNIAYDIADKITVPALIVHGDADTEVPVEQSIKLAKLIPSCQLKIIPGAGHRFQEGNAKDEMLNAIVDFIVQKSL